MLLADRSEDYKDSRKYFKVHYSINFLPGIGLHIKYNEKTKERIIVNK